MNRCSKCGHRDVDICDLYSLWFGDCFLDNTKPEVEDTGLGWLGIGIFVVISAVCLCLLNWYIYHT